MKLGARIAISHTIFGLIAVMAIFLLVDRVWVKTFEQLEQNAVRENVNRARLIWNKEQETLKSIVGDWAPWDDLYAFARNPQDQKFVKDNLPDSAMVNLRIDAVAVTDPFGKIMFAKAIDMGQKQDWKVFFEQMGVKTRLGAYGLKADAVDAVLAKLEAHRMTKLGERRDVTLEVSRKVLELAL